MKRLLAIILAVALLGTMAISAFAADASPAATATEDTQTAGNDIVVTVDEADIEDGALDLADEVTAEEGDTITLTGLPDEKTTEVTVSIPEATKTTVLRDKETGKVVLGKTNENGTYTALVDGDCQLDVEDNAPAYTDMPTEAWAADSIDRIAALEILIGYGDGTFDPEGTLTGAQVVTALSRLNALLGGDELDTTGADWYVAPLAWATEAGLTDGSDPFVPFTRQQLIDILAKFAGVEGDATEWATTNGLFVGDETGDLMAEDNLTRAQFAAVITRYIDIIIFG